MMNRPVRRNAPQLKRVHELLHMMLAEAEEMLAEQPDRENTRWMLPVIDKMLSCLHDEFRLKERETYLSEVIEQYPEWQPQVQRLLEDHRILEGELRELRNRLEGQPDGAVMTDRWRQHLHDWMQALADHEHNEARLVQEAFVLDPGEGE